MPVPATTGQLRERIEDMKIGDYIVVRNNGGDLEFGKESIGYTELPFEGRSWSLGDNGYYHYWIKVDKGLLVADRVRLHSVSWDSLNSLKFIEGARRVFDGVEGVYRSLTGGCAYADENGNMSLTDKGFGAFPTNNEWDKYIVNFPQELIQEGKTLDDVFHISRPSYPYTWCQETPVNGVVGSSATGTNARRVVRAFNIFDHFASNVNNATVGFRPVFEYKDY